MARTRTFSARLTDWHQSHGRHDLPWQQTRDPYRVWLSEIMLQQTQVATVIPYYHRFLERFPTLSCLAEASVEEVMTLWSGLGYYARARNLHRCAQVILEKHGGHFPGDADAIALLPGIGRSTANAIAVFCFGARRAILDGNVKRVLCRTHGIAAMPGPATEKLLWQLADSLLPPSDAATHIQAQMDLGATVCTRTRPACLDAGSICPLADICAARRTGRVLELPLRKQRKPLPQRDSRVLVLHCQDRVLLERRPPSGIWGGLLSLPELPAEDDPTTHVARVLGCDVGHFRALPPLRHDFTHFRLRIQPLAGEAQTRLRTAENQAYRWLDREGLETAALPTPVRKILRNFFDR